MDQSQFHTFSYDWRSDCYHRLKCSSQFAKPQPISCTSVLCYRSAPNIKLELNKWFPWCCSLHLWVGVGQSLHPEEANFLFFSFSFLFYLNQTDGEEVILFPSLSLVQQDILFDHTVLNEELASLPRFDGTQLLARLVTLSCFSMIHKQTLLMPTFPEAHMRIGWYNPYIHIHESKWVK